MENLRLIKFLDVFQRFFEWLGIDYAMMRKILAVKLTMDARRAPVVLNGTRNKKRKESNLFLKSLWLYALTGLFLVPIVLMGHNFLFQMSLIFGIIMFMVMMSMIADFSSVLLDTRDKSILYTKPIDPKTLQAAKAVHVCLYLLLLTGSLAAPSAVAGLLHSGPLFLLLFLPELVLLDLFVVTITALIYLLILKFFDGERLKDVINYVQIILSFSIAIGYQLLVRAFDLAGMHIIFHPAWWQLFIPPLWFSSFFAWLLGGDKSPQILVFSAAGIVLPLLSILIYSKCSPAFEAAIQKLSSYGGKTGPHSGKTDRLLGQIFCSRREEQVFFHFAALTMKNDRPFKLKVYPMVGFSLIFPFIFIFTSLQDQSWAQLQTGKSYFFLYFSLIMIPTAVSMLKFSGSYKGAWIFGTAPIKHPAFIYSGTLKAFIIKLLLPVYLVLTVVFLAIFKWMILPDLVVIFITACLYSVFCYKVINGETLPFSRSFETVQEGGNMQTLLLMAAVVPLAGLHAMIGALLPGSGLWFYALILLAGNFFAWRKVF
ncbi:hypothetical protein [Sporolactobacillus putidus]|uniref:Uncharacterized protein n=1 Tax=Sporolactobacillus putidus TaxID=492735 RepID=A0A917S047_9BACL|nr:hypothetical protein [Sporolactobacillus putidus]GGL49249.1 hypothetical protein GCM10007968_11740 [Sporolactobacillus putidus]